MEHSETSQNHPKWVETTQYILKLNWKKYS